MNSPPDLSFIIETVNVRTPGQFDALDRALESVRAQTVRRDRYEVVVVVDPTRQPALAEHLRASAPDVRVAEVPSSGYYAQKNAGAVAAAGEIVGFVDADCQVAPSWVETVLEVFARRDPTIGAVVGSYDTHDSDRSAWARVFLVSIFGHQAARTEREIPSLAASNCAFRRRDIVESPFDDDPHFHGSDVRRAAEIKAVGGRILLVPGAANRHEHSPGLRAMLERGVYWGYCFVELRRRGSAAVPYAKLVRALGPAVPLLVAPAKLWIDLKRLAERRRELAIGVIAFAECAALLALNALAAGIGAARSAFRLAPPVAQQLS